MKKCIIFPVSMKNVGILYHFTELAIVFYNRFKNDPNIDFYVLSEPGEQHSGLWDKISQHIPENLVNICHSSDDFPLFIEEKIATSEYSHVIYLSQGIMQFYQAIHLKRKYKNKLWLYTRLNSFRHGTRYRGILTFILSLVFRKYADFVNFQCEYTARIFWNSKFLFRAGKAGIIPLGLAEEDDIIPGDSQMVGCLNDTQKTCVVYLAYFHKHKRHSDLISFMHPFLRKNPDLNLFLVGDGAYLDLCKSIVANEGLESQIHFPGRLDRKYIPYILRRVDLAIVFSKAETFGHNILEPLFYGTPVVSSNVGIAPEVVKDFHNGALLCSESAAEFGKKVSPFLSPEKDTQDSAKKACIRQNYNWNSIVDRYEKMFETIGM